MLSTALPPGHVRRFAAFSVGYKDDRHVPFSLLSGADLEQPVLYSDRV
jgi:hypothetical protein